MIFEWQYGVVVSMMKRGPRFAKDRLARRKGNSGRKRMSSVSDSRRQQQRCVASRGEVNCDLKREEEEHI